MNPGQNNAIVVAHPDDAELWAGGLPLRYPDCKWTIICCSVPRRDPIRAFQAKAAAKVLGADLIQLPHIETDLQTPLPWLNELALDPFDFIVTHGEKGEYGHIHHVGLHDYIVEKYSEKRMTFFGYGDPQAIDELRLDAYETTRKIRALECYPETIDMLVTRFFGTREKLNYERYSH